MNTELTVLQNELTVSKLQNEITDLKYKLQKVQAEKTSRLEDSLFSPALYTHYRKVAETLSKSSFIPAIYKEKPDDIFVAMAMGYQLGFPVEQSLQDIAVVNGRPCLWGDGLLSLALSHPQCESINEEPILKEGEVVGYICTVKRKGHPAHSQRFTMQDALKAKLFDRGAVWKTYPARMLQMRARSLAIRDKFADALRGIRISEIEKEDSNIIEAETATVIDNNLSHTDKLKQMLGIKPAKETDEKDYVESSQEEVPISEGTPISEEQLQTINALLISKRFDEERINKVLAYYKVNSIEELSYTQANLCLFYLQKVKTDV